MINGSNEENMGMITIVIQAIFQFIKNIVVIKQITKKMFEIIETNAPMKFWLISLVSETNIVNNLPMLLFS
jgi:hypothetical protein